MRGLNLPILMSLRGANLLKSKTEVFPAALQLPYGFNAKISQKMSSKKLAPAQRVAGMEPNIWVEFVKLAADYNPVNLGQGYPDFMPPSYVTEALAAATQSSDPLMNQYTRSYGHVRLVKVLAQLFSKLTGHAIDPLTDVLVTGGAYESLYCSILGNVNPGDEVIIIEPFFDCYEPMVLLACGIPVFIPLRPSKPGQTMSSNDWELDPDELASKFNHKTKAIIINTPNNPLGKVFKREELEMIGNLAKKWDVLVIMDEVYEWMTYEGREHVRMATLPDMWERTITIGSAGKTFSVTGWKIGWTYGPKHLLQNCQALHQNSIYTCPTPTQEAVAVGFELELQRLGKPESYFMELPHMLKLKRDKMAAFLEEAGMKPVIPEGGYFMLADYTKFADRVNYDDGSDKPNDHKFCRWLVREKKIAAIPPTAFYGTQNKKIGENYLRFCFIKEDSTIDAAEKIIKELKNL